MEYGSKDGNDSGQCGLLDNTYRLLVITYLMPLNTAIEYAMWGEHSGGVDLPSLPAY